MSRVFEAAALVFGLLAISLAGCDRAGTGNNSRTIDDVLAHFRSVGLAVGEKQPKLAAFIGAADGCSVAVDGMDVEIYKYDLDVPVQQKLIAKYEVEGITAMGTQVRAERNGSFLMIAHDEKHPKRGNVVAAFTSF